MIGTHAPRRRRYLVHSARVVLFVCILALIRAQYGELLARQTPSALSEISIPLIQTHLPDALIVQDSENLQNRRDVFNAEGEYLGYILQTSPDSDHIVGFSGPTNLLLVFDADAKLRGVEILSSADTPAHVKEVELGEHFWATFEGQTEGDLARLAQVDGVSGATLTSMAIQEAIMVRLGGARVSLRFPDPLTLEQVQRFFPDATVITPIADYPSEWIATKNNGDELGRVLRTSPSADARVGYQGPTDTLIGLDSSRQVIGIWPGATYDNEEYVEYIELDEYFRGSFNGISMQELSELDLRAAQVEGVSGATMTSMAMARGMVLAAADERSFQQRKRDAGLKLDKHDVGTVVVVGLAMVVGLTRLRGNRKVRIAFPLILIIYLGLVNGDMLSLAMISGWARHGIPWTTAPSLVVLSAAALLLPITSRHNVYCHHLCPHGAAQQLLRKISPKQIHVPDRITRLLKRLPGALLLVCVVIVMTSITFSLVDVEPFDAWVFQVAGWATITIALAGLIAAFFVPMAYCRFGCPTGFLLNFLRFNAHSDRWTRTDWIATGLLAVCAGLYQFG